MGKIIFTAILIVFPLGQLIKFGMFNLFDIAICILAMVTLFQKPKYPNWYKYFLSFILFSLFSLVVNYKLTEIKSVLYLVRLFTYSYVAIYVSNYLKDKKFVVRSLLAISIASATLGWIQYLFMPDMRFMKYFGWDDHLYRMVGTFFDPTYLALVILLGIIIALYKNNKYVFYALLVSLAFTYSRAAYLALGLLLIYKRKYIAILIFIITVLLLPKTPSEGTNLLRTASNYQKLENYKETLMIFKKSPAIGVGFNNICLVKEKIDLNSHSCFGADSSLLFILATTGVIGFILFLNIILHVSNNYILVSSFLIVLIHSLFTNSLFYPHIMFWLFSLIGLGSEVNGKRS